MARINNPTWSHDKFVKTFNYIPETGFLVWRVSYDYRITAGKEAGSAHAIHGYHIIRGQGIRFRRSRGVWFWHNGVWPANEIDHINGIRNDDRIENLRDVTKSDNMKNTKVRTDSSTGVPGVGKYGHTVYKWRARINVNGLSITIGLFTNFDEAVAARRKAEVRYGYTVRSVNQVYPYPAKKH